MADAKVVITAEDRTKAALRSAKKNLDDFSSALTGMKGQITALAGVAGIGGFIKASVDLGDQLAKTSQKVGISVEALSAYQYAAKLSGLSNESLTASLARLTKSMQEAAQDGTGETARYFQSLGIAVTDSNGKLRNTGEVLEDLSRKFASAPDGPEKTAAAIKLLGRSGAEAIPFLNTLKEGTDEAKRLGLVVSTDFAKAAERFNDQIERMKVSLGSFLAVTDRGGGIMDSFLNVLKALQHAGMLASETFQAIGADIAAAAGVVTEAARGDFKGAIRLWKTHAKEMEEMMERGRKARALLWEDPAKKPTEPGAGRTGRITLPGDTRADDRLLADAQAIGTQLMTEEEKLRASYANRLGTLTAAREQEMISQATFNENRERLEEEHQFRMIGLISKSAEESSRLWASGMRGRLQVTQGILGQLGGLMQSSSERMFRIGKAAALSNAAISMGESIASAAATKPFFPLGLAMVAKATLLGKSTIDQIRSTQFGGSNATGTFNASPSSGLPTGTDIATPPPAPLSGQTDARLNREINVTLIGSAFSPATIRDELIPLINDAIGDGVQIRVLAQGYA